MFSISLFSLRPYQPLSPRVNLALVILHENGEQKNINVYPTNRWYVFPASRGHSRRGKKSGGRETFAGSRRVSYHACADVSAITSYVFLTCDTTHRTGLRAKLQLKRGYVLENSSQSQTMPRTPQSRKFGKISLLFLPDIHAVRLVNNYPTQAIFKI